MAESITVHPAAAALVAYVNGFDLVRLLQDDAQVTRLKALLVEHQVLFLPDQQVEPVVFEELAQCFGWPVTHAAYPTLAAAPFVQVLQHAVGTLETRAVACGHDVYDKAPTDHAAACPAR